MIYFIKFRARDLHQFISIFPLLLLNCRAYTYIYIYIYRLFFAKGLAISEFR